MKHYTKIISHMFLQISFGNKKASQFFYIKNGDFFYKNNINIKKLFLRLDLHMYFKMITIWICANESYWKNESENCSQKNLSIQRVEDKTGKETKVWPGKVIEYRMSHMTMRQQLYHSGPGRNNRARLPHQSLIDYRQVPIKLFYLVAPDIEKVHLWAF